MIDLCPPKEVDSPKLTIGRKYANLESINEVPAHLMEFDRDETEN